eukprot:gene12230-biopygen9474
MPPQKSLHIWWVARHAQTRTVKMQRCGNRLIGAVQSQGEATRTRGICHEQEEEEEEGQGPGVTGHCRGRGAGVARACPVTPARHRTPSLDHAFFWFATVREQGVSTILFGAYGGVSTILFGVQ